ncbi:uncharacterized protein LOC125884485 isoform X5 [Epinephelus fuscoguttatus]|uniref:uncharacterized protein LOC125884485 isoform X4 n=1 Tax=Epinephelus fuscoguttatus TaxID=293821 RepID=UPI0020D0478D|nr:uncharacterized protein LOC125884485 isoform X4 [Epinephelus fuscoguttatus]XP_049425503.1 uncharacterized protein LOC125884485 isoform X5 [Epinephelus fuscoguttatus]
MMKCSLITALIICSLGWISVSAADSQTVEVQSGKEVSLTCSEKSDSPTVWFRVVNRTKASWISTMMGPNNVPSYCDGCKNGAFEMSSNKSAASLKMKKVNVSDSGLYFCVAFTQKTVFSTTHLNVEGSDEPHDDVDRKPKKSDDVTKLMSVILGGLTAVLLTVIIGLVVTIRKLQKAASEEQNPPQCENPGSDDLNYAAVNFCQKGRRREVEQNVVYSSTR